MRDRVNHIRDTNFMVHFLVRPELGIGTPSNTLVTYNFGIFLTGNAYKCGGFNHIFCFFIPIKIEKSKKTQKIFEPGIGTRMPTGQKQYFFLKKIKTF